MSPRNPKKGILSNVIAAAVLLGGIIFTGGALTTYQDEAVSIKQDLANLEYINASTQRLVKLAVLEQDTTTILDFLEQENQRLLTLQSLDSLLILGDDTLEEYINQLYDSWDQVHQAVISEELDEYALFLASDNHFFKISNLTTELNKLETSVDKEIQQAEFLMIILSIFSCIYGFKLILDWNTERKRNKEMAEIAVIDGATGLYNRSKCQELLQQDHNNQSHQGKAIIIFDLNDLKLMNDTKGHRMGDAMIFAFATALSSVGDSFQKKPFLGRYGGDEFVVYFDHLQQEQDVSRFVETMGRFIQEHNERENEFSISYAVGYAFREKGDSTSIKALFEEADRLMYANKQAMKNKKIVMETVETVEAEPTEAATGDTTVAIERRAQSSRRKNRLLAGGLGFVAVVGIGVTVFHLQSQLDYIGGNVLYLSADDPEATVVEDILVPTPWKNASLSTMLLYQSLFTADATLMEVSPALATSYTMSEDGMTYVLQMNPKNLWSDGTPLTAEDVVFSIESFLLCENVNVYLAAALQTIVGYQDWRDGSSDSLAGLSVEGNLVTMELEYPYSNFIQALAQFVPLPKHILEEQDPRTFVQNIDYYHQPVGSGMYMVDVGDEYTLVRNPYYEGTLPLVDEVVFLPDYNPLELDFYTTNVISEMVNYRSIRGFEEYPVDLYFYRYFNFNMAGIPGEEENPLENILVRNAIFHALDRPGLLDSIYFNTGTLITSGLIDRDWREFFYEYSPVKARAMLEEADYDFSRPFTIMYYYNDAPSLIFMDRVVEYLEDIGLIVELKKSNGNEELYVTREYDMMLKGLSSFNYEGWYNEFSSSNPNMSKVFNTTAFDELLLQLSTTTDPEEYDNTLLALQELELELLYKLPLFTLKQGAYVNTNRLIVPDDMVFGNSLFRYDLRFDEWSVLKS